MTNAYLSLVATAAVVATVLALRWRLLRGGRRQRAMVAGGDLFTKTLVELFPSPDLPAFAALGWFALSVAVSLGGPSLVGMETYALEPREAFVTINYTIVMPLLFGSYVFLIVSIGHFEAVNLDRLPADRHRLQPWLTGREALFQAAFFIGVMYLQWRSIDSEIRRPWPCSPWIDPPAFREDLAACKLIVDQYTGANDLSVLGLFHYALRGINAFIGLGLVVVIISAWHRRTKLFGTHDLSEFVFPRLGPTPAISRVGTSLVACVFFGSLVTATNGLSLWSVAGHQSLNKKQELLIQSTWMHWAALTVVATFFAGWLVLWLHQRIKNEARSRHEQMVAQYTLPLPPPDPADNDPELIKRHAEALGRDLAVRLQIGEVFAKVKTWPLPALAGLAVLIAASSQVLNIGAAIYGAVIGKPAVSPQLTDGGKPAERSQTAIHD